LVSVGTFVSDSAPYLLSASLHYWKSFRFMHSTAAVTFGPTEQKAYQYDEHLTINGADSCIYALLVAEQCHRAIGAQYLAGVEARVDLGTPSLQATVMALSMHAAKRLPGRHSINPSKEVLIVRAT
jgi:hypothetical protein